MSSPDGARAAPPPFDVERVRADFPALAQRVHERPLVYLDSASTALKPRPVIEAVRRMYERDTANIHRGVHALSVAATAAYEAVRDQVRRFLGAAEAAEIVFTRGTTEAINLVAQSWGRAHLGPGDEVLISELEHHSNLVPWQMVCAERGARLRALPIDERGQIDLERAGTLVSPRTRLLAISQVSNALGTVVPVRALVDLVRAQAQDALVLVDGAQAVAHLPVDVRALGCDFYCFSGHKLFGPTGVGVLYGRRAVLEALPPWQGGGEMIASVSFAGTSYREIPYRFEAGTPPIAEVVGLGAALDYLAALDPAAVRGHEAELLAHGTRVLSAIDGLELVGTAAAKVGVLAFTLPGIHPHDIGTILDREGIAIRTGHHCAQPLMARLGLPGTARASLAFYNTRAELDALGAALALCARIFR